MIKIRDESHCHHAAHLLMRCKPMNLPEPPPATVLWPGSAVGDYEDLLSTAGSRHWERSRQPRAPGGVAAEARLSMNLMESQSGVTTRSTIICGNS
jgi:hypothetical protein